MISIGLDIAKDTFTASAVSDALDIIFYGQTLPQSDPGWQALLDLVRAHRVESYQVVMENTGVYAERCCQFLYAHGVPLYVEPPAKIKQAFYERGKSDPLDSRQIAEYAIRFADRLHPWQPKHAIVEEVQMLLTTREQVCKMNTACQNMLQALRHKHRDYATTRLMYTEMIQANQARIKAIEKEMLATIQQNPLLAQTTANVMTIQYFGMLLTVNLLICTNGFTEHLRAQGIAAYAGICPFEYASGVSIRHRPKSDKAGPLRLRKLLYLAAMRMRQAHPEYQRYFERKVAEGNAPRLVLNNIANRLVKLFCGVVKSGKPYLPDFHSCKPE